MSLATVSIQRPTFITCIVILMLTLGILAIKRLGVDLFPDITFPVITISTVYPGAGPSEVETLITKPLEDELSSLAGIKRVTSTNLEALSQVIAEFTLETDIKYAEQQVRDRIGSARSKFPIDAKDSVIRRIDPSDQPIAKLSLVAKLSDGQLFDIADQVIRPKLEQINQVGLIQILGGRKREIHVVIDRKKLKARELSVSAVSQSLAASGENIPSGKVDMGSRSTVFRTLGQFTSVSDIQNTLVSFFGNEVSTRISDLGEVKDTLEDETQRAYVDGKKSLIVDVYRQSGANTIAVVDSLLSRMETLNSELKRLPGEPELKLLRDGSLWVRANVEDVQESIIIGIFLAVVVVFLFLGSARSTIITGLALPNSLIGAFVLMAAFKFTINIMTLLALSLSVGLLIDDAIVVRENIFRRIELGEDPVTASRKGTEEVTLAVIATTLTVIAIFGPVGFLGGVIGQFLKQFGLTVCFAMAISLFDALTIAPMLSAYFAGPVHKPKNPTGLYAMTVQPVLTGFDRFQSFLENAYGRLIEKSLKRPWLMILGTALIVGGSCSSVRFVPKTFLPPQDSGEFMLSMDLPPGTSLEAMDAAAKKIDAFVRSKKEVLLSSLTVGGRKSEEAVSYVRLVPRKDRKMNTIEFKEYLRGELKQFSFANPQVKDFDPVGAGQRPFELLFVGMDQKILEDTSNKVLEHLKKLPGLKDVDTSYRLGKPEFQVRMDPRQIGALGISSKQVGVELRAQVEGLTPVKYREKGQEYDVRVRLKDTQRNLKQDFNDIYIPNLNYRLVRLADVAIPFETTGPAAINRQDRGRLIKLSADLAPGAGLGDLMQEVQHFIDTEVQLPPGVRSSFTGQAENFKELTGGIVTAMGLGVLFIFMVLASLYESFITPLTIIATLPAISGSVLALAISGQSLNIFSMIGIVMLLGVSCKNAILLVDRATHLIREDGLSPDMAMVEAGKTRLRPILMTSMALIAGTLPIALGLNEASKQRTSMGIAIIGGLISSTLLTLLVVPSVFRYVDALNQWSKSLMKRLSGAS